jgi:hypothetical protein
VICLCHSGNPSTYSAAQHRFSGGFVPHTLTMLAELYEIFQQGECSLGYLAEQLDISSWEAIRLLEARGLRTTNL